ncbi:MAG TPA: FTR1 family protein [Anaerolineales bacterium]|nr:FTR1 family protein [Anaerolineales bacterium]
MITSIVLSLREGLEAALIISIVFGALKRTGRSDLNRSLWAGVISAIIVSLIAALILRAVDQELVGTTEQIFEGATLLLAAGVLTWMIFWMRRESQTIKTKLESNVTIAASVKGGSALYFLAFFAVLREGIELALYMTAASMTISGLQTLLGAALGLSLACLLGYLVYSAAIQLNLQRFFKVTSLILILFAAGLIGHSVAEFNEAGIIPAIINPIWNLNPILSDNSLIGTIFSTLVGYHGSPSLTEALGYGVYILATSAAFLKAGKLQTA